MSYKQQSSELSSALLIAPAVRTTDSAAAWVDLRGFDSATIELILSAGGITFDGTNKIDFELYESDDNGTTSNLVPLADILGETGTTAGILRSLVAAQAAANYLYAYIGAKRYIALVANFAGTHGVGTGMCATAVRGMPRNSPTANA